MKKKMRSHRSGADGVVRIAEVFRNALLERVPFRTTPSAPSKEASRRLLNVASTPPISGGEWPTPFLPIWQIGAFARSPFAAVAIEFTAIIERFGVCSVRCGLAGNPGRERAWI
jgi:hypothetical protein